MKDFRVQRLVASEFIRPPKTREQAHHKNGNRTDNSVSNLEWVSPRENINKRARFEHRVNPNRRSRKTFKWNDATYKFCGNLENEKWTPVKWTNGMYEISDLGRVRRIIYNCRYGARNLTVPKICNPACASNGIVAVTIKWSGVKTKKIIIHREVAKAFVPNPNQKETVNHKNGVRMDNRANNLEWMTLKENISHSVKNGFHTKGIEHWCSKLTPKKVKKIRSSNWSLSKLSRRFNVSIATIANVKKRKSWKWLD